MKKILTLTLLTFMALSFTSCSDDKDEVTPAPVDIRDQMATIYTYENTNYYVDGSEDESTGTIEVRKSETTDGIVFLENGQIIGKGTKLQEGANGIAFDLEDDSQTIDGILYEQRGVDFIELDGAKYNGAYDFSTGEIGIAFDVFVDGTRYVRSVYLLSKT